MQRVVFVTSPRVFLIEGHDLMIFVATTFYHLVNLKQLLVVLQPNSSYRAELFPNFEGFLGFSVPSRKHMVTCDWCI